MNVFIPLVAVLAIYARENGQGMGFGMEPGVDMLLQAAQEELEAPTLKSVESAPRVEQSVDKESSVKKPKKVRLH
ncbi:MAG: ClpXP protease specificity-enhancing factor SspB [Nitrincola sp.]|nr:ClpXP protease specificity-enhancing factor SspB [Nitrincola sp.]